MNSPIETLFIRMFRFKLIQVPFLLIKSYKGALEIILENVSKPYLKKKSIYINSQ